MARKQNNNSLLKVILTDLAGIGCLVLVPFLGPLPGPGGIPLILAGFGFFAVNHDWADNAIHYIKKHSENLQSIIFPDKTGVKLAWDVFAITLFSIGLWMNIYVDHWLLRGLSIGTMASASTIFMLNRNRLSWLDKQLRRTGKK
jgi:uncharacterized membrane protein